MSAAGFSLVELVVALALMLTVMGAVFGALDPANGAFAVAPEAADMQQRLRVAVRALEQDLEQAGAGPEVATAATEDRIPAVLPFRLGPLSPDLPGVARSDLITIVSVARHAAQTTITQAVRSASAATAVVSGSGCPLTAGARDATCGLRAGMNVALTEGGRADVFRIDTIAAGALSLRHASGALSGPYEVGSRIVEIRIVTYYLNAATAQLMRYNGLASDAAVVDQVVMLAFEYFGDPPAGASTAAKIAPADLAAADRVVRRIAMRIRVRAAPPAFRRPIVGTRFVPDLESRVDVALRNQAASP